MSFVDRLDATISARGTTRKAVAAHAEITVGNIATWKVRSNYPTADVACKIASFLGVSVEYLVTGESVMPHVPARFRGMMEDLEVLPAEQVEMLRVQIHALADVARSDRNTQQA